MKGLPLLLISMLFFVGRLLGQDSLSHITELEKLLRERKMRFDAYAQSAEQRSGIFKTKTKKDLEQSREILLEIVKTDNQLLNELDHAIVRRGIAKADYSVDELTYKETVDRLSQAADTLNKQLISARELNASIERKAKSQELISYFLLAVACVLMIWIFNLRRKLRMR